MLRREDEQEGGLRYISGQWPVPTILKAVQYLYFRHNRQGAAPSGSRRALIVLDSNEEDKWKSCRSFTPKVEV